MAKLGEAAQAEVDMIAEAYMDPPSDPNEFHHWIRIHSLLGIIYGLCSREQPVAQDS